MSITITIRDESTSGDVYHEQPLEFPSEHITARELIRERVYQEVQDFNRKQGDAIFRGLVQPTDTERVLNGGPQEYRLKKHRDIDWKQQFENAITAFSRNGFFILVDNQQVEDLDQQFEISSKTQINYVKLTMRVGG